MYKRVSGVKFWLLGCCTFGIYPIYIWHKMAKNLNIMAIKAGEKTIRGYIGAMLLGCITFGIAYIYITPYMSATVANFYNSIKPVAEAPVEAAVEAE